MKFAIQVVDINGAPVGSELKIEVLGMANSSMKDQRVPLTGRLGERLTVVAYLDVRGLR